MPTGELVVKDPRLVWFLGMWRGAAIRCRATPSYITMLRPVTEVVGSKQKYYAGKQSEISRTAGWVNVMLHTEVATRDSERAFVRYADLLDDWTVPVFELGERLRYDAVLRASAQDLRKVHSFIDPSLRRVQLTWDDVVVPARLREIAQATLGRARPAGRQGRRHSRAARDPRPAPRGLHRLLQRGRAAHAVDRGERPAGGGRHRARPRGRPGGVGRGGGSRVPHALRAMVPPVRGGP